MRRPLAITLLLFVTALVPGVASAQSPAEDLLGPLLQQAIPGGGDLQLPAPDGGAGDLPADGAAPPTEDFPTGTTPIPPPYLTAGPAAQRYPVSTVARITEPEVSLHPLAIATLTAAALALLLILIAGILRATGTRTAAHEPVVLEPATGSARLGDAMRGIADDMRDFLRRSR